MRGSFNVQPDFSIRQINGFGSVSPDDTLSRSDSFMFLANGVNQHDDNIDCNHRLEKEVLKVAFSRKGLEKKRRKNRKKQSF